MRTAFEDVLKLKILKFLNLNISRSKRAFAIKWKAFFCFRKAVFDIKNKLAEIYQT